MKAWKKYAAINVGMCVGLFISIFVAPENTPLWVWAAIACTFLAVMNYRLFRRLRKGQNPQSTGTGWGITIVCLVLFLLDLILNRLAR
jgi:hypothetical protein